MKGLSGFTLAQQQGKQQAKPRSESVGGEKHIFLELHQRPLPSLVICRGRPQRGRKEAVINLMIKLSLRALGEISNTPPARG